MGCEHANTISRSSSEHPDYIATSGCDKSGYAGILIDLAGYVKSRWRETGRKLAEEMFKVIRWSAE